MTVHAEILEQTREALIRSVEGQIRFSDVYPEVVGDGEETWWRKTDFDGKLTDAVECSGFPTTEQVPIGLRPWLANYGLVLTDDLVRARNERVASLTKHIDSSGHPDILKEIQKSYGAILALANYAPRDDANTENGANGSDFYLAITDSGLEIYATPLSFLRGLEVRNRLTALYRIPTNGHPEFNGEHEQFRSARVVRTRRHPEHLVTVFEYETQTALIEAKLSGAHPNAIPIDARSGHIAFVDKFGNIKLELNDTRILRTLEVGRFATLLVKNNDNEFELKVQVAEDLRSASLGKLVVYANCSDYQDESTTVGLVELHND